jgi:hypothetical protein
MQGQETFASLLGWIFSGGAGTYTAVLVALVGMLIWQRTKSSHVILTRAWRFFHGKKECTVKPVADFLNELSAIDEFSFKTGIRVTSLAQIERLNALCPMDRSMLERIAKAGKSYDLNALRLAEPGKVPSKGQRMVVALGGYLLVWLSIFIAASLFYDRAVLQMKASRQWFTLDADYAKPLNDAPGFKLAACARPALPASETTGFSAADTAILCAAANIADTQQIVKHAVRTQRYIFGITLVFLLYFSWSTRRWLRRAKAASDLTETAGMQLAANASTPAATP